MAWTDEKITVMPNGVSSSFRPIAREAAAHWLESRYPVPPRFILTVGDLQPRKNHIALIRAFEELLRTYPDLPHHLVLVGKQAWRSNDVVAAAKASPAGKPHPLHGFRVGRRTDAVLRRLRSVRVSVAL